MLMKTLKGVSIRLTLVLIISFLIFTPQLLSGGKAIYLHGEIEDIHGNKLSGVKVLLYSSGVIISSTFSMYGSYSFFVEPGSYSLEFRLEGYEFKRISIAIPSGVESVEVPVVLDDALSISTQYDSISIYEGGVLSIPVTCTNKGFTRERYFIDVNTPKSWDVECYVGSIKTNSFTLDPGGSVTLNVKVGVPYGFIKESNQSSILIRLSGYRVYEKRIDVSIEEATTTVISSEYNLLTIPPSETKTVKLTLANPSFRDVEFKISTEHPKDWVVKAISSEGLEVNSISLKASGSTTFYLSIGVPFYMESGNYSVLVKATSSIGGFNHTVKVYVPEGRLNMVSTRLQLIESLPGEEKVLEVSLVNLFNEGRTVEFSLEAPSGWIVELQDSKGSAIKSITLGVKEGVQLFLKVNIPENINDGDYPVVLRASSNSYRESMKVTFRVSRGYPDTRVNIKTPFIDVYAGGSGLITFSIENRGRVEDIVRLRVDGLPSGFSYMIYDEKNNVVSSILLGPNDVRGLTIKINTPPKIEPSIVNASLIVKTSNKENSYRVSLNIVGKYQVEYVTKNFYVEAYAGETARFILDVRNTGYSTLTNVAVSITDIPSSFSASIDPSSIPTLEPLETRSFSFLIDIPPNTDAGDYYIAIKITSTQAESTERLIHVAVKQRVEFIYIGVVIVFIALAGLFLLYRRYGRR